MARILVIDDEHPRFVKIEAMLSKQGHDIHYSDGTDALVRIAEKWDVMFLDHDLGLNYPDGYELAKAISENPPYQVVVHSMNIVGARNMVNLLKNHVYKVQHIPYSTLVNS
jgi:CheY-like chemotaxis protein